ncbi:hypothetical protein MXD63_32285 [Frankia sp. Cpl3]|uniref:hypothetical protein n=1 Tax=Parafrankia colletiae TaxID=573497 RepID=UPI0018E2E306|nr:hypothetical protein [Parafrankia colletiae]MCK9904708.1 hypothetical protein [Frankia sp. Cpl3]
MDILVGVNAENDLTTSGGLVWVLRLTHPDHGLFVSCSAREREAVAGPAGRSEL